MITLEFLYTLMGVMVGGVALVNLLTRDNPKRLRNALFWGIYAVTFLAGSHLPDLVNGVLVIAMAVVASAGGLGQGKADASGAARQEESARRWGNLLFVPALIIPAITLLGTLTLKGATVRGVPLVDPKLVTLISLGIATLVALAAAMLMLRPPALATIAMAITSPPLTRSGRCEPARKVTA